jgi:carboxypeptidase C (cathepsin A)
MSRKFSLLSILLATSTLAFTPFARAAGKTPAAKSATPAQSTETYPPPDSVTHGAVTIDGQNINYTAVAGILTVGATDGQDAQLGPNGNPMPGTQLAATESKNPAKAPPEAHMSFVYYYKSGARRADRPITFIYNGGPGSSTVWLLLGAFGPERVLTPGDTHLPPAPYKLEPNPNCLLDASDLVFIDAPGTGFGTLTGKNAGKAFWGVHQDARAFARFIQRFLSEYHRWDSPKYLLGESYGTTRSAVLANDLENDQTIDLNGVVLLSQIFNFTSDIDEPAANPGIDLPYELALPTYAATAWFHKDLPQQPAHLLPLLKEVEAYAMGPYRDALTKGTNLSSAEERQVAEKLHQYTGLPASYWVKADLRVSGPEFEKTLQTGKDLTTGRLDTRFSGPTIDPLSENAQYDPQSAAISSAYISLFNRYVRQVLKFGQGLTYVGFNANSNNQWQWTSMKYGNPSGTNVSNDLADAMKMNPRLKVMVNGGYFDLATPFYAARYEDKHLPISPSVASNIQYHWYKSGHMIYVRAAAAKELHNNVAAFIKSTDHEGQ